MSIDTRPMQNVRVYYAKGHAGLLLGIDPAVRADQIERTLAGNCKVLAQLGQEEAADLAFRAFNSDDLASRVSDRIRAGLLPGVTHSSMSVGDAVRFDNGAMLVCAPFGWEVLEAAEPAAPGVAT